MFKGFALVVLLLALCFALQGIKESCEKRRREEWRQAEVARENASCRAQGYAEAYWSGYTSEFRCR